MQTAAMGMKAWENQYDDRDVVVRWAANKRRDLKSAWDVALGFLSTKRYSIDREGAVNDGANDDIRHSRNCTRSRNQRAPFTAIAGPDPNPAASSSPLYSNAPEANAYFALGLERLP